MTLTQKPPHRANGRGHDTEEVTSMQGKNSATKVCGLCQRDLPLTIEHWLARKDKPGAWRDGCRECRNRRKLASYHRNKKRALPEVLTCTHCGADFEPHKMACRKTKFCSRVCRERERAKSPGRAAWKKRYEDEYRARPEVREKQRQASSEWRANNPEYLKAHRLSYYVKWKYGITQEAYEELLAAQEGRCAICRGIDFKPWDRLVIDHCHDTGVIRGLLCHSCNVCIGQAKDDPTVLRAAVEYLERER